MSAATPVVGAQSGEEKTLHSCNDITEGGTYQVTEDIHQVDGSGAASCIHIRTDEDVVIEGNGHSISGNGQNPDEDGSSYGILVSNYSHVTARDVTIEGWDIGIDPGHSLVVVENGEIRDNGDGLTVNTANVELYDVRVAENDQGIWHLVGGIETYNTEFVENGAGVTVGDGCGCEFVDTEFSRNDAYGFELRHMTRVDMRDVSIEDNGGPGVHLLYSNSRLHMEGGTVAGNGGAGIDGTDSTGHDVYLNDTSVRDNGDYDIETYDNGAVVYADGIAIGEGLTLSTEAESLNVVAEHIDWAATDGVTLEGEDLEVNVVFSVGTEDAELWERIGGTWERQSVYEGTGGSFQENLGSGTWVGDSAEQTTPTPTETESPTPTPQPTNTETRTPTETPSQNAPTPSPARTTTQTPTESGNRQSGTASGGDSPTTDTSTETGTGTPEATENPTPTAPSPTPTTSSGDPTPDEPTGTDPGSATDTDESIDDDDISTEPDTDNDDLSTVDGPGFDPLVALFALLASTLLLRNRG